jgi:hypothetical protein
MMALRIVAIENIIILLYLEDSQEATAKVVSIECMSQEKSIVRLYEKGVEALLAPQGESNKASNSYS